MSTVDYSNISTEERPVGLRTRPDLVISESVFQGEVCWIVKDPIAMKYFRLRKPEYLVLKQLEIPVSYQEIKTLLTRKFPDATTRIETVQQLVISLHQNCLLISEATGQSMPLQKRRSKEIHKKVLSFGARVIAIRFPGFDPERFLQWIYPKCRYLFTQWFTFIVATVVFFALSLILTNLDEFTAKLPEYQRFFAFDNILFMGVILVFTKSIHELGHGLMCKHFGGECHQIGFMLLVMTPAMYCDTSDSWTLPNRWHRMAIGAAGMYVEIFLAAICTFIWWFTNPGWIHYLALNIMFLCSISTIFFNANPLLRYDGYYILSDFLEIPNLAPKARMALASKLRVWCLGLKPVNSRQLPERNQVVFAIYSVVSFVYRTLVIVVIFWVMSGIFEPIGLAPIGHVLIGISLATMVVMPVYKTAKFLLYPGRLRKMKRTRLYATTCLVIAAILFVCLFPIPHYVWASFVVRPENPQIVMLNQRGILESVHVSEGESVSTGELIAKFNNDELAFELESLLGKKARLENDLYGYQLMTSIRFDSASRIAETQSQLSSIDKQIELKQLQVRELNVIASRDGVLFPPANRVQEHIPEPELPLWTGTPLDSKNIGAMLDANTLLGMVGSHEKMEVTLIVDQSEIKLLEIDQEVIALAEQYKDLFIRFRLSKISRDELLVVPRELSQTNGGPIPVEPNLAGGEKPILKSYEAYAQLSSDELSEKSIRLLPGMRGTARIHVGNSSMGSRIKRYLSSLLKF